jgi:hypothetical protein
VCCHFGLQLVNLGMVVMGIVTAICTLKGKYFDYSHVTSQRRGTEGFHLEILTSLIVIE